MSSALSPLDSLCSHLQETEKQKLLFDWNQTQTSYETHQSIHSLVFRAIEQFPDATAIAWHNQTVSYAELGEKALRLTAMLVSLGVGPEVRVGICMSRCPDMIVAMLAVLAAGGAYVPMDPNYPSDRLQFMLEDAKAPVLITQKRWQHLLNESNTQTLSLDEGWDQGLPRSTCIQSQLDHQTAYVLFTSGSTGRPKGVQIEHRSVVAMLSWATQTFSKQQRKAILGATSICFDLSVFEIFLSLSNGTTLVLAQNALDLPNLEHPVSLINTVPSAITELYRAGQIPPSATTINLAGEPLRSDLVNALYSLDTVQHVYNLYGPSEDTTYSTWARIPQHSEQVPAIGRPLANTQAYLLNASGHLVSLGEEGELFLAGDGLARGYLDQPGKTAERFLPNPFDKEAGARFYKTGDLVRYREDSNLDFLGRLDHQVKIRGFRIELGEIEECLRTHEQVLDTVVVAIQDGQDPQLAAYIARKPLNGGDHDLRQQIRQHVGHNLPNYMVPNFIVLLDSLPQTPNGKVDRKALPKPGADDQGRVLTQPRTPTEQVLSDVWQQALGLEQVGVFEDFFDLGGDSIRALRIVTHARDKHIALKTVDLFRLRTIAQISDHIAQQSHKPSTPTILFDNTSTQPASKAMQEAFGTVKSVWPATHMQEGMLFQSQYSGNSADYADTFHFVLEGCLDPVRFKDVWQHLCQRYMALRTVFHYEDGQIFQLELANHQAEVHLIHQAEFPQEDPELTQFLSDVSVKGFQPTQTPPWRVYLLQESAQRCHVVFSYYHVILDGWSLSVLFREFSELCQADQIPQTLPEPIGYHRFLNWWQAWNFDEGKHYWQKRLAGYAEKNSIFPLPKPDRPSVRTMEKLALSAETTQALNAFARQNRLTMNTLAQGAFALVLARYSRQSDVVFGNSVSGRTGEVPGIEKIVGLCLQTVTSRVQTNSSETLTTWLHGIQDKHREDEIYAYYPLAELQASLGAGKHKPLFDAMLAFENYAGGDWPKDHWAGLPLTSIFEREDMNAGMILQVLPEPLISLKLHCDQNRFEPETTKRLLEQLAFVLENLPANAQQPVRDYSILPKSQVQALTKLANAHQAPITPQSISAAFENRCQQTPHATAAVCENTYLSYQTLNQQADNFANRLLDLNLQPEEPVGICIHRDQRLLVAYLGILKAGGVILPIDPKYPASRKQTIAQDASLRLVITERHLWPQEACGNIVALPSESAPSCDHGSPSVLPNQLAYIIYTSGSTGKPKGVGVSHEAFLNQAHGIAGELGLTAKDRVLQFTSHSFDISVNEIFNTLIHGGTLVIKDHRHGLAPDALYQLILQQHLTMLTLPTGFWRVLSDQLGQQAMNLPPFLRFVTAGGERVMPENLTQFQAIAHSNTLFGNCYGPTECAVTTSMLTLAKNQLNQYRNQDTPIGNPLPRFEVRLYSEQGRLVPQGCPGELHIGGPSLARGYLGKPALTALSFVPHPHAPTPGARLYRTGDLIRFNQDGHMVFMDRVDRQVKVRGFRIELGEVEFAIRQYPQVGNAFVTVENDPQGGLRLVAYAMPAKGISAQELNAKSLATYLDSQLPHFMVPSAFAIVETFPLTISGKLDTKSLPQPVALKDASGVTVAPTNQTQKTLVTIWAEVLKLKTVGIHDNFFDLGGHSLSAVTVHQKIQTAFQRKIPLVKIFEFPNIAGLSSYLSANQEPKPQAIPTETNTRLQQRKKALRNRRRRS